MTPRSFLVSLTKKPFLRKAILSAVSMGEVSVGIQGCIPTECPPRRESTCSLDTHKGEHWVTASRKQVCLNQKCLTCDGCEKTLNRISTLPFHQRFHTREKPSADLIEQHVLNVRKPPVNFRKSILSVPSFSSKKL